MAIRPVPVWKICLAKLERVSSFRVQSGKMTVWDMIRLKVSDQRRPTISSSKIFLKESLWRMSSKKSTKIMNYNFFSFLVFWDYRNQGRLMVEIGEMVFCYQNCSDLLWEKIILVIKKNFWNWRLKAENLPNFWVH